MTIDDSKEPYGITDYNELEAQFVPKFLELFARVDAQQPHKGVRTLILRARKQSVQTGRSLESTLDELYQGAVLRTERRLQLIQRCSLKQSQE